MNSEILERRDFLRKVLSAGAALFLAPHMVRAAASPLAMTVYKTPSCGCCKAWVAGMQRAGFTIKIVDLDNLDEVKRNAGVPGELQACHTALVGAYVVEGHVPADLIKRMLDEKPQITGLAVPGMPAGSPGMDQGAAKEPYAVIAFTRSGKSSVYARR